VHRWNICCWDSVASGYLCPAMAENENLKDGPQIITRGAGSTYATT